MTGLGLCSAKPQMRSLNSRGSLLRGLLSIFVVDASIVVVFPAVKRFTASKKVKESLGHVQT